VRVALLLALFLLLALPVFVYWFVHADTARVVRAVRLVGVALGALFLMLLVASGRVGTAAMLLTLLLPVLLRNYQARQRRAGGGYTGPSPGAAGRRSQLETRFLRMELEHASGAMRGEVLEGRFRGRMLDTMSPDELVQLLEECRADPQSAAVLEAYLDRVYGPDWRQAAGGAGGSSSAGGGAAAGGAMSREEAYEILGLAPGASPEEVRAAHRRLMQKFHPDRGGSDYIAAKLNQAKDLLLGD
jgi:DnaJ-domain-containing protein 1